MIGFGTDPLPTEIGAIYLDAQLYALHAVDAPYDLQNVRPSFSHEVLA